MLLGVLDAQEFPVLVKKSLATKFHLGSQWCPVGLRHLGTNACIYTTPLELSEQGVGPKANQPVQSPTSCPQHFCGRISSMVNWPWGEGQPPEFLARTAKEAHKQLGRWVGDIQNAGGTPGSLAGVPPPPPQPAPGGHGPLLPLPFGTPL